MARRLYSNTASPATLTGGVASSDVSFALTSFTGYPAAPFTATISRGEVDEEVVLVTSVSGATVSTLRGYDGTTAKSHAAGSTFLHTVIAKDFDEANAHVNQTTGVHGLSSAPVGVSDAQILSNKTLNTPVLASPTITGSATMGSAGLSGSLSVSGVASLGGLTVSGSVTVTGTVSGATPTAAGHLATKAYADALGTPDPTPSTIIRRRADGYFGTPAMWITNPAPANADEAARKDYVDATAAAAGAAATTAATTAAAAALTAKFQRGSTGVSLVAATFDSGTVTFPAAYATPPTVLLSVQVPGNTDFVAVLSGAPSATGFSWRVRERGGSSVTATAQLHWVAVG